MMICGHCEEEVTKEEMWGSLNGQPAHQECLFRLTAGSAAHVLKECSCYGGTRHDPPGTHQAPGGAAGPRRVEDDEPLTAAVIPVSGKQGRRRSASPLLPEDPPKTLLKTRHEVKVAFTFNGEGVTFWRAGTVAKNLFYTVQDRITKVRHKQDTSTNVSKLIMSASQGLGNGNFL